VGLWHLVVIMPSHFCGTVYAVKIFDIFRWNKKIPESGLLVLASCCAVGKVEGKGNPVTGPG
jgi:hypothetical protein